MANASAHTSMTGKNTQYNCLIKLLSNINMLCFGNWPEGDDILFGDEHIRKLSEKLSSDERCVIRGFRENKVEKEIF